MSENNLESNRKLIRRSGNRILEMNDTGETDERGRHLFEGDEEEDILQYNPDGTPKIDPTTGRQETERGIPLKAVTPEQLSDDFQAKLAAELANDPSRMQFMEETLERARKINEGDSVESPIEEGMGEPELSNTQETVAVREQLIEAVAEPMGEAAIDEMESEAGLPTEPFEEEPAPEVAEAEQDAQVENSHAALGMKAEYDRRVNVLLDQDGVHEIEIDLGKLEDEMYRLAHSLQPVRLKDASEQLRATIASIENDSYGIEPARTKLTQIEKELAAVDSLLRAATEAGVQDIKSITDRTRKQIADVSGELQKMQEGYEDVSQGEQVAVGPDADTSMVREELQAISADFEAFALSLDADRAALQEHSRALQVMVNQLSDLIRQTYTGRLESSELYTLYATLLEVANGLGQVTVNQKTAPLIETTKGHLTTIKQQRNLE